MNDHSQPCCTDVSRRSVLLGAGVSAASLAIGAAAPATANTSDSKLPYKGDWKYRVTHYEIVTTILTGASGTHARVSGVTTMTCVAATDARDVYIDFALAPASVTVNGVAKPVSRPSNPNPHQWAISRLSLAKGESFTIQVRYDDVPAVRCATLNSRGVIENGTVTTFSGEPEVAVYWYPSNDRLDNKATYDITISTQRDNQILGYGATPPERSGDGSTVTSRIQIPEPVAGYHPGITVGPGLAVSRGTLTAAGVTVPYLYAGMASIAPNLVTHTAKSLGYFANLYGSYPYSCAGGITLTALPVGGQEHVGMVTFKRSLVDGAPSYIAHENAHMWFGNSVTAKDWRDVLLIHEGLATLLQNDYARYAGLPAAYTPVKSTKAGNLGPSSLATNDYNYVYGAQRALRYAMDRSYLRENAPRHTAFLKDLATRYRHGTVTRSQFKALAQSHSRTSLASVWADYGITG